jgi:hypothetical protein
MTQSARWQAAVLVLTLMAGLAVGVAGAQARCPVGVFLTTLDGQSSWALSPTG